MPPARPPCPPLPPLPPRDAAAHKYDCGRVLVVAGSRGMLGAGALASRAAYRGGAGLVTWAAPEPLLPAAHAMLAEALVLPLPEAGDAPGTPGLAAQEKLLEAARMSDAVVLGPGLPHTGECGRLTRALALAVPAPLVLDAGGLVAFGEDIRLLAGRKAPTVLTPHEGEMARLAGARAAEVRAGREGFARRLARDTGAVVALKGPGTVVAGGGGEPWTNPTGNPGLATAGTGDVLAGLVAALLAQGMGAWDAARLGAYLHGLAGDLAAEKKGVHGLMAGDVVEALPEAYLGIEYGKWRMENQQRE